MTNTKNSTSWEHAEAPRFLSLSELAASDGRVYVHLPTVTIGKAFLKQAVQEGFSFVDGVAPTSRLCESVMAINHDKTINYVGSIGRIAFQANAEAVGGEPLIRVIGTIPEGGGICFELL